MKTIKYICVDLDNEEVYLCTTITALAHHMECSTKTLSRHGINNLDKVKYKHFLVFINTIIHKLKRGRKCF